MIAANAPIINHYLTRERVEQEYSGTLDKVVGALVLCHDEQQDLDQALIVENLLIQEMVQA